MKLELIATATFGLEAVVRREIEALGYRIIKTEDGKVTYMGDERAIVRSNLWLRTADRVLLKMAEFSAVEFEELFQQTKGLPWEQLIPLDGRFTVTGTSVKSKLHSVPACQKIVKKAIVEKLKEFYGVEVFEETGAEYTVKASLLKDRVTLTVDTSGTGLHKRGYRISDVAAPIKETLAAAMIQLSFWKKDRILVDPCCGSGTIPIEAAMIGRNIAPGLNRGFVSENWSQIPKEVWEEERQRAKSQINKDCDFKAFGYDIDRDALNIARENAYKAGVGDRITFEQRDIKNFSGDFPRGTVITNPPYGERLLDIDKARELYKIMGQKFAKKDGWSYTIISPDDEFEKIFGRKADKRRKLYNGMLKCQVFMYFKK